MSVEASCSLSRQVIRTLRGTPLRYFGDGASGRGGGRGCHGDAGGNSGGPGGAQPMALTADAAQVCR